MSGPFDRRKRSTDGIVVSIVSPRDLSNEDIGLWLAERGLEAGEGMLGDVLELVLVIRNMKGECKVLTTGRERQNGFSIIGTLHWAAHCVMRRGADKVTAPTRGGMGG